MRRQLFLFLAVLWTWSLAAQDNASGFYVFFKKPETWNQVYLYTWYVKDSKIIETSGRWPGKALADVAGWYRGYIDRKQTDPNDQSIKLVFTNGSGEQTPDLSRRDNGWYVWKQRNEVVHQWFDLNPEEKLYSLTVQNGSGSGQYSPGSLVQIQAATPEPSLFTGWTGDVNILADPKRPEQQFSMPDRDIVLTAAYEDLTPGQKQYQTQCALCHGQDGEGGAGTPLLISLGKCTSCGQVEKLAERISKTMPLGKVGQCTGDCARDVARYIRYSLNPADAVDCKAPGGNLGRRQLRLLTEREYRNSVRAILGVTEVNALQFWPEPANVQGYNNNADAAVVTDRHLVVFARAAREIAEKARLDPACGTNRRCIIEKMGLQLYRRPLTQAEVDVYANMEQTKMIETMLQSPYFLYRSELGTFVSPMNAYALDPYEVASALAYTLTGTPPDQTLLGAAADGSIKDPAIRRREAERLLATAAARETFTDFAMQWLGISSLPYVTRDNPKLTAALRADMLEETKRLLSSLIFDQNGGVKDLFAADSTPLSKALAAYYGLPVPAQDWQAVNYDKERRGLIAQGSILVTYANSTEASPIKRGVFVRNRLLCQDLPPPPANVDTTIPPPAPGLTMRERLARHLSQGQQSDGSNSCASCHQYIDKLGFGFERFDEIGLYREFYAEKSGVPIDVSGEIKSPLNLSDPSAIPFQTFAELGTLLSESPTAKACFGIQYLRYAQGHLAQSTDQCLQTSVREQLQQDKSLRAMMMDFVGSDSFVWRK
jgi:mono/diheme cytochrome c family protein